MHNLCTDEAALKVAVDLAGSLRGLGALPDGPGAAFLLAVGQEADEAQQLVAGLDELVQTCGLDAHFLQRTEGKEYVVNDGDVIEFLFNV